ncbi:MAG: hypothetical protein ACLFS3_00825 [Candidatus Aenigmatarchaeota archaeon]
MSYEKYFQAFNEVRKDMKVKDGTYVPSDVLATMVRKQERENGEDGFSDEEEVISVYEEMVEEGEVEKIEVLGFPGTKTCYRLKE